MRVLVTGGAGFIGSHLTDALLARGDEVSVADDLSAGHAARVHPRATLHKLSITDAGALNALVARSKPELICHLAAQISVTGSVANPAGDAEANVVGTVNVLEAARTVGARVLFCSSGGALYGRDSPIPALEDVLPLPESPYGVAKYCAEQYVGLYNRLHGTQHSALRLANVYGPRQDAAGECGVVPIFCSSVLAGRRPVIYGDGSQTRDYVYVGDVVTAFLAAADRGRPGTWNIGTGTEVSVLELAGLIGGVAGRPAEPSFAPPRAGELQRSALAVDRARRDLGWSAATALADGLRAAYQWIAAGSPDRGEL
jgi:UDP-glucose 4-epimerase